MTYNMNKAPGRLVERHQPDRDQGKGKEDLEWLAGYKQHGIAYAGEFSPNVLNPDGTLNAQAFMLQGILGDPYIRLLLTAIPSCTTRSPMRTPSSGARNGWMRARPTFSTRSTTTSTRLL